MSADKLTIRLKVWQTWIIPPICLLLVVTISGTGRFSILGLPGGALIWDPPFGLEWKSWDDDDDHGGGILAHALGCLQ